MVLFSCRARLASWKDVDGSWDEDDLAGSASTRAELFVGFGSEAGGEGGDRDDGEGDEELGLTDFGTETFVSVVFTVVRELGGSIICIGTRLLSGCTTSEVDFFHSRSFTAFSSFFTGSLDGSSKVACSRSARNQVSTKK